MISIIGAGPSGNYLAYLLAQEGKRVQVFEEHHEIGSPIQCTGLVTNSIKKFIDIDDDFFVNAIQKVRVFAPDGNSVDFNLHQPNYILDRYRFDRHIAKQAMHAGAEFFFSKRFENFDNGKILFQDKTSCETDIIVGSDGPLSSVAKNCNLFHERKFMLGLQARVKGHFDSQTLLVYLGAGYFGWSVPENKNYSRVGIIANKENPQPYFKELLKKTSEDIIEYQSGLIPLYQPKIQCQKGKVFLLGDAATQCKGSTHGGIIQGMIAATALKDALIKGEKYDKLWKKRLGKDLYIHLKIREKMNNMSEKDLNYMIKLVQQKKIKRILEKHDRDFAFILLLKLLIREPRFLKFAV